MTDFDAKARELLDMPNEGYSFRAAKIATALKDAYNNGIMAGGTAVMKASGHGNCDDCTDAVRAKMLPTGDCR